MPSAVRLKHQGMGKCFLAARRDRTGDDVDVYLFCGRRHLCRNSNGRLTSQDFPLRIRAIGTADSATLGGVFDLTLLT